MSSWSSHYKRIQIHTKKCSGPRGSGQLLAPYRSRTRRSCAANATRHARTAREHNGILRPQVSRKKKTLRRRPSSDRRPRSALHIESTRAELFTIQAADAHALAAPLVPPQRQSLTSPNFGGVQRLDPRWILNAVLWTCNALTTRNIGRVVATLPAGLRIMTFACVPGVDHSSVSELRASNDDASFIAARLCKGHCFAPVCGNIESRAQHAVR